MSISGAKIASVSFPSSDIEKLRGQSATNIDAEKAKLRKATEAFESFFMYQTLKTMRKTIPKSTFNEGAPFSGGSSKDIFTEMFDMELANKMVSGDQRSLSAVLYDSLVKLIEAKYNSENLSPEIKPLEKEQASPIPVERNHFEDVPKPETQIKVMPEPAKLQPIGARPVARDHFERVPQSEEQIKVAPKPSELLPNAARPAKVENDPILSEFGRYIDKAAKITNLDPAVIISVIRAESNGDAKAISSAGAKGLMQLIDSTAADYGVTEVFDPEQNIKAGSRFLKAQLDRFGSLRLALAAYNAGPENVKKYGGVPPFKETEAYVEKVMDTLGTVSRTGPGASAKGRK